MNTDGKIAVGPARRLGARRRHEEMQIRLTAEGTEPRRRKRRFNRRWRRWPQMGERMHFYLRPSASCAVQTLTIEGWTRDYTDRQGWAALLLPFVVTAVMGCGIIIAGAILGRDCRAVCKQTTRKKFYPLRGRMVLFTMRVSRTKTRRRHD